MGVLQMETPLVVLKRARSTRFDGLVNESIRRVRIAFTADLMLA